MTSKAVVNASIAVTQAGANTFNNGPFWNGEIDFTAAFGSGVVANAIDVAYMAERTVASGATDSIDLNGVIADALGAVIASAELVALFIKNAPKDPAAVKNTTALTIGGGSTPVVAFFGGTTPTIKIGPGGLLMIVAPDANGLGPIVAATSDLLQIVNASGAQAKYQIGVLARTA